MAALLTFSQTILAAAVGAAGAIGAGIVSEWVKRSQAKAAVAGAFYGEITALSSITDDEDTVALWEQIADQFERGELKRFPPMYAPEPSFGPVFESHVQNIGLLSRADAEGVLRFYHTLYGIRFLLRNLTAGAWISLPNGPQIVAQQIRRGVERWRRCAADNVALLSSLRHLAERPFPWSR